jgi:hypothetical protein
MRDIRKVLEKSAALSPQSKVDMVRGMSVPRTKGGIAVLSIHYSGDPDRDPAIHPGWKEKERKTYSSQAAWDREQEMIDEAGGGELVFADTLLTYWNKIVITDPGWRPSPHWRVEAGFDHGKTNPTALLRAYIDGDGVNYFCGEYYMPGKEVWEHVGELGRMPDIRRVSACYADPSMFDCTMQQSINPANTLTVRGSAKSINDLYVEQGIELFSPFALDRSDVGFAARLLLHWSNLDTREPTIKIVCRNRSEQPQHGLHPWDCPNLLWELMRTRREKLTAQQLLTRNVSERIVDKDNHARDAMKYLVMSLPEPATMTARDRVREIVKELADIEDFTSAYVRYRQHTDEKPYEPARFVSRRSRMFRRR